MIIYHWTTVKQALKALQSNKLAKRRWGHFIPEMDAIVKGTSWSAEPSKWQCTHQVCFMMDTSKISNEHFHINGNKTYLRTQGMINPVFDSEAWKYESDIPDECFVVGDIVSFKNSLRGISFASDVELSVKNEVQAAFGI